MVFSEPGMTTDLVDFIPQYAIFDMPNLFDNVEQMRGVLNSDFADVLGEINQAGGIRMLGYSDAERPVPDPLQLDRGRGGECDPHGARGRGAAGGGGTAHRHRGDVPQ